MRAFEDLGYFCVDNLPPELVPKFAELIQKGSDVRGAALVIDMRGDAFFGDWQSSLTALTADNVTHRTLFLEADEETLIQRYQLSRRRHPLETEQRGLVEAIRCERDAMMDIRGRADVVIDTTEVGSRQLRKRIEEIFRLDQQASEVRYRIVSFGFKHGLPKDSDLVLDVRFIPNPHYVEELRTKTGNDPEVERFVFASADALETLSRFMDLLDFLVTQYRREGKPQVTVAVGCTGGQHRSVVFANHLAKHLEASGLRVSLEHRDVERS
jgi:UPF0042 nucleotide-binding protein